MSNCKVIALTNQKGGVGKTTTAVNLGVSLAKQGKTVLLVDADAQANLTMALGYTKTDNLPITLSDIMQDIIDGKSVDVQESILHTDEGVDLLPSCVELAGVETTLIDTKNRESVLKACISEVKKNYDYVLIDCMPALGMLTINGLAAADSVIIPNQPHYFSIKGLEQLLRSVSKVKRQINPNLRIDGILMTMVMPRTKITQTVISAVKNAYGRNIKIFDGLLQNRPAMSEYARRFPNSAFRGNYCTEYGFRVDTEKHAYLLRCNLTKGDYNFYCYCYVKEWLDKHISNAEKGIRFISSDYKELFRIPDGGKIRVTSAWGEKSEHTCRYIDEYHTEVGNNLYHICEFAERMEKNGATYEPIPAEPQAVKAPKHKNLER